MVAGIVIFHRGIYYTGQKIQQYIWIQNYLRALFRSF